ncbi:hypothetical protein SynRS9902_02563 [Synechococcus sp. RS9902]|nr:hypothetical protein SynRS9902_02563 [Synechococcus sp. RS9902]
MSSQHPIFINTMSKYKSHQASGDSASNSTFLGRCLLLLTTHAQQSC